MTRFSRIGLNAIHEGWRVLAPLVLVIVQFAKYVPPRRMPHTYRGNRNYFLRFFFLFTTNVHKTNSVASDEVARNCVFDIKLVARLFLVGLPRFLSNGSRNHGRDTEIFVRIHRFLYPLSFHVRCPSSSEVGFDWNEYWISAEIYVDEWLDIYSNLS